MKTYKNSELGFEIALPKQWPYPIKVSSDSIVFFNSKNETMRKMKNAELVLNSTGAVYHLNLFPGDVSETIFLVGDPGRAKIIADHFDEIELSKSNREINTFTGYYKGKRLSVLSTGMGTDNIEIVVNELDALFNIDFKTKLPEYDTLLSGNVI